MHRLLWTLVLLAGCSHDHWRDAAATLDRSLVWPDWVAHAYAPLDDRIEVIREENGETVTRHTSTQMACAGTYSCIVGWRDLQPVWMECKIETQDRLWSCIHMDQPRPVFRFTLKEGRIASWTSETPMIEAVIRRVREDSGNWYSWQLGSDLGGSQHEHRVDVIGFWDAEEPTTRTVVAVRKPDGVWVADFTP